MNILISIGGTDHYFAKANYRLPKPLIKIVGRPMLFWLLDYLDATEDDIIYIATMDILEIQYDLTQTLKVEYPKLKFQIIIIDFETRGAVETLFIMLQAIPKTRLDRKTISLGCDTVYFEPIIERFRQLPSDINASFFFEDQGGKPIFSYLQFKDSIKIQNYSVIVKVSEKIMISNYANTGAYAFRSGSVLKRFCSQVLDAVLGDSGEYNTTKIIQRMADNKEIFLGIPFGLEDFVCLGTPDQLNQFLIKMKTNTCPKNTRQMRFCFNLDSMLLFFPKSYDNDSTVQPKTDSIQLVRELHAAGHCIIIQITGGTKSHKGSTNAVAAETGRVALATLNKFEIPFDEVLFSKPYADIYISDSAIHSLIDTTKEIGWTLKESNNDDECQKQVKGFIASRHFHSIQVLDTTIIKSSSLESLQGEIYFYQNIPSCIKDLFPQLHRTEQNQDAGISSIIIERIKGITYSHLLTNLCLTDGCLVKLLMSLKRMHSSLPRDLSQLKGDIYANYCNKVLSRYRKHIDIYKTLDKYFIEHDESSLITSLDLMNKIVTYLTEYERSKRGQHNPIIHGDPVFSNALLTLANRVVFLDMRGALGPALSLEGDVNYDLAKVYQSLNGYDFILLDKAHLLSVSKMEVYLSQLRHTFEIFIETEYSNSSNMLDLKMITAHLYFSLIPLHNNFRHQIQFYKLAAALVQGVTSNRIVSTEPKQYIVF